jgi:hypothetical protein
VVGQVDPVDPSSAVIEPHHDAPCGLRCAGSGTRYWVITQSGDMMHSGMHTCPVCKPRPCPVCAGQRVIVMTVFDALRHKLLEPRLHRRWESETEAVQRRMTSPAKCPRCKGTGMVSGDES